MDSIVDVLNKLKSIYGDTVSEERLLHREERNERKFLKVIREENPSEEDLRQGFQEFFKETEIVEDIAENIFHISEGEIYLENLADSSDVKSHIREIESEAESFEELAQNFYRLVEELDRERQELNELAADYGIQNNQTLEKANKRFKQAKLFAEKGAEQDNGISRRGFVTAAGAVGLGSYWLGNNQDSSRTDASYKMMASAEIFERYNKRIKQLTKQHDHDLTLPIALGERHVAGDSFKTLKRIIENYNVSKVGLEFLYYESNELKAFNEGRMTYREIAEVFFERGSWQRVESHVVGAFKAARENNVEIFGLEPYDVSTREGYSQNYSNHLERSKAMVDIVEKENDGNIVVLAGSAHVDSRMSITTNMLKNAHPKVAYRVEPDEVVSNPFLYQELDEELGIPSQKSLGKEDESKIMYKLDRKYTFVGRINSMTGVCSTHPNGEKHKLEVTAIPFLKSTKINEKEIIKKEIEKAKETFNEMAVGAPYMTMSESGYTVFMEPNPLEEPRP